MPLLFTLPLSLLCGALLPYAFAPYNFKALAVIGLVGFLFVLLESAKHPIKIGIAFGFGWFGFGGWWLADTIHTYGHLPYAVGLLVVAGLGLTMALFIALWAWSLIKFKPESWHVLWLFPALGVVEEWLRSFVFTGLPWTALGNLLVGTPASGWLSVVGVYGGAALLLWIASAMYLMIKPATRIVGGASLLVALIVVALAPQITLPNSLTHEAALIQPNIPQDQKWDSAFLQSIMFRLVLLSEQASDVDLIVWPEAAVPLYLSQNPEWDTWLAENFKQWDAAVAFGGIRLMDNHKAQSGLYLQAANQARSFVGKHHLVPFGEYVPDWLPWLHKIIPDIGDFEAAHDDGVLLAGAQHLGAIICYESLFPEEAKARVDAGAQVLVVVTNDAWYGKSPAAWQHFQASQVRAIETGRYVLRAANTGISAIIAPDGSIQDFMPWWQSGFVRGAYQPLTHITPYQQWGDMPLLLLIWVGLLLRLFVGVRKMR